VATSGLSRWCGLRWRASRLTRSRSRARERSLEPGRLYLRPAAAPGTATAVLGIGGTANAGVRSPSSRPAAGPPAPRRRPASLSYWPTPVQLLHPEQVKACVSSVVADRLAEPMIVKARLHESDEACRSLVAPVLVAEQRDPAAVGRLGQRAHPPEHVEVDRVPLWVVCLACVVPGVATSVPGAKAIPRPDRALQPLAFVRDIGALRCEGSYYVENELRWCPNVRPAASSRAFGRKVRCSTQSWTVVQRPNPTWDRALSSFSLPGSAVQGGRSDTTRPQPAYGCWATRRCDGSV